MNRFLACLSVAILLCAIARKAAPEQGAQIAPKQEPETQEIKVKTELMEVRAVVTDQKGRIVENLTKDDFELLENDQPQQISFFSISKVESGVRGSVSAQQGIKEQGKSVAEVSGAQGKAAELEQARTRLSEPPLRSTLLFVDNLHLSFSSLNRVKETLRRFINERLTDQDMVALATSGQTLGLAQQFTRDRQLLKYAIEQIRLGPASHEELFTSDLAAGFIAQHIDAYRLGVSIVRREEHIDCPCGLVRSMARARALQILSEASYSRKTTFSILKDFAEQMTGLPGKRMIVAFSDGFTMRETDGGVHYDQLQSAIDRAVRSGVVIYSIDAKGLQIHPTIDVSRPSETNNPTHQYIQCPDEDYDPRCDPPTPEQLTTSMSLSEREEQNGLHAMAEQTGGVLYTGNNDLDIPLGQAFDANRFFYVLSYYLEIDRQ